MRVYVLFLFAEILRWIVGVAAFSKITPPTPSKGVATIPTPSTLRKNNVHQVAIPIDKIDEDEHANYPKTIQTCVAVTGATGRTGRLVVKELLQRGVQKVIAIVRDAQKAEKMFPDRPTNLDIQVVDLTSEEAIVEALHNVDVTIWCATGFSDTAPPPSPPKPMNTGVEYSVSALSKFMEWITGVKSNQKQQKSQSIPIPASSSPGKKSIDIIGLPAVANCMVQQSSLDEKKTTSLSSLSSSGVNVPVPSQGPKVVMLSSAGVTRTVWDKTQKEAFAGAADIPIVRLNPFGILDLKRESEQRLRTSGVEYCIVRPTGLNDDWPVSSRPVLSQGDVAVGRIHRQVVAEILVNVLNAPEAVGKTFEVFSIAGYPKSASIRNTLARLRLDADGPSTLESVAATYSVLQQLLPGGKQDAAALAMGQTYEQLDRGVEGRLGRRGEENAEAAAPKPTT